MKRQFFEQQDNGEAEEKLKENRKKRQYAKKMYKHYP